MSNQNAFKAVFLTEIRRRLFEESFPRLRQCLAELSEDEIWYKANDNSNAVGNLALHLCGNVRQWIVSGLGGETDNRQRDLEFLPDSRIPVKELLHLIDTTEKDAAEVLRHCTTSDLLKIRDVQIYKETGIAILIHVVEHFSYHVGQITYFVKYRRDIDMGYYEL